MPSGGTLATVKVGVLVVAYEAQDTLRWVLDRIPTELRSQLAEVLVMDDHSSDRTTEVAHEYAAGGTDIALTIVRHDANLGYGGNQKAGYRYAIDHGWDVAVLLHGDGQYAPEKLPDLIEPIVSGDADAVFGSRMLDRGGARRGGMPLYKFVGNRILTTAQNALTGAGLSEWHSGYRAYRVSALADLAFVGNSNDFDFDTEIILQLLGAGKKIVEVPIPTYYGDEISRVNGLAYAAKIMVDTTRHRLGSAGFGRGDLAQVAEEYQFKPSPGSSHGKVLDLIAELPASGQPLRILDVGCGPGHVAAVLRQQGHHVTGVDIAESDGVRKRTDAFHVANLENGLPAAVGSDFDVVIAADVIEHVARPESLINELASAMRPGGTIIASVPNFGHWYPRSRTAAGLFDYDQRGILDRTHLRFFTRRSFRRLLDNAGLTTQAERHAGLPLDVLGIGGPIGSSLASVDRLATRIWPTMFAYQFVVSLVAAPHVRDAPAP